MSDPIRTIERLAAHARLEKGFQIHVADRVIPRIRRTPHVPVWPVVWIIVGVAALAGVVSPLIDLFADPWSACFALFAGG